MEKLSKRGVCSHDLSLMEKHRFKVTMLGLHRLMVGPPCGHWRQRVYFCFPSVSLSGREAALVSGF